MVSLLGLGRHPGAVVVHPGVLEELLGERVGDVEQRLADLEQLHARWHAPIVRTAVDYTRLALVPDDELESAWVTLQHERWAMPYVQARALLRLGRRLRRARRTTLARAVLHAALDLFAAMPAPTWEERTRDALRAAGERLPAAGARDVELLTPQELRVTQFVAEGATNKEVAERLFLSPRTIDYHLRKIFTKLGITSRSELIRLSLVEGDALPAGGVSATSS